MFQLQDLSHQQSPPPLLAAYNLHKTYLLGLEGVPALRGVSLEIRPADFLVILGNSGGGKTSLLNILGTIDKQTRGDLSIAGDKITSSSTEKQLSKIRLEHIGFVFQTFNLIQSLSALQNVKLPMQLKAQLSETQIEERALKLLQEVGLLQRIHHYPTQLSGGEQQRVTIARALANQPQVLLLDQPTGDLDTKNTKIVLRMLLRLNKAGKTLVMVTHDINLKYLAKRVIKVSDGKIISQQEIDQEVRREHQDRLQREEPAPRVDQQFKRVEEYALVKWIASRKGG